MSMAILAVDTEDSSATGDSSESPRDRLPADRANSRTFVRRSVTPTMRPISQGRDSAGSPIPRGVSRKSTVHLGLLTPAAINDSRTRSSRQLIPMPLQSPRESIRRSRTITPAHIARPEGVSLADRTAKRNKAVQQMAPAEVEPPRQEDYLDIRIKQLQTPKGETSISHKEEILETIMSAEAQSGFAEMARNRLERSYVTRVGVNPDLVPGLSPQSLSYLVDGADLEEDCSDSDDELVARFGLSEHQAQPGDDPASTDVAPEEVWAGHGTRIGFGLPQVMGGAAKELQPERVFTGRCGSYAVVGVVNAHGQPRIAGELALFIAEVMPSAVFRSSALARRRDPAGALTDAFRRVHRSACLEFDLLLTGASVTVVLLDQEHLWVASVGDCRAVLGVPDPHANAQEFHFVPVPLTQDHKPALNAEFDRIQSFRGQMRHLVEDNVMRIFLQGGIVPGLTLSRGIGHRLGHTVGISHDPTITAVRKDEIEKGSFLVIGSGGLWATMSERAAVNWVSRYFSDPGEAADSLTSEAFNRWEDPAAQAKRCLRKDAKDCFSSAIIFFKEDAVAQPAEDGERSPSKPDSMVKQRTFVSGPMNELPKKEWEQVKSPERTRALRKQQSVHQKAQATPQEEVFMVTVNRRRYE